MKHPVCQECGNEKLFKRDITVTLKEKYAYDGEVTEQTPEAGHIQGWAYDTIGELGEKHFGEFGVRCGKCGSEDVKLEE